MSRNWMSFLVLLKKHKGSVKRNKRQSQRELFWLPFVLLYMKASLFKNLALKASTSACTGKIVHVPKPCQIQPRTALFSLMWPL